MTWLSRSSIMMQLYRSSFLYTWLSLYICASLPGGDMIWSLYWESFTAGLTHIQLCTEPEYKSLYLCVHPLQWPPYDQCGREFEEHCHDWRGDLCIWWLCLSQDQRHGNWNKYGRCNLVCNMVSHAGKSCFVFTVMQLTCHLFMYALLKVCELAFHLVQASVITREKIHQWSCTRCWKQSEELDWRLLKSFLLGLAPGKNSLNSVDIFSALMSIHGELHDRITIASSPILEGLPIATLCRLQ